MYNSSKYCLDNIKYDHSCYSLRQLKLLASIYNEKFNDKININQKKINLWNDLKLKLNECKDELCWMLFLVPDMRSPFKPLMNPDEELDANTLYKIAKSFENKDFTFFGIGPSNSYSPSLFNKYFNIKSSKSGAFILNLSREGEKGSHWILLYIKDESLYYYDSLGPKSIQNKSIKLFLKYIVKLFEINNLIINEESEQDPDTNLCGYYVLRTLKNLVFNEKKKINKKDFILY